jgi:hypothetical protein
MRMSAIANPFLQIGTFLGTWLRNPETLRPHPPEPPVMLQSYQQKLKEMGLLPTIELNTPVE